MLLVTPIKGSWPEPRPVYLITGDRAVQTTDAQSRAALQTAGVQLTELSAANLTKLLESLTPEVMEGIDPDTGKLLPEVMPDYLSEAAVVDVDLRNNTGKIDETYIPNRLSVASLNAMLSGGSASGTTENHTVTGTSTITTANVNNLTVTGPTHAQDVTATQVEAIRLSGINQTTEPASPSSGRTRIWTDANSRLRTKDSAGRVFLVGNKRIVSSWPAAVDSSLGDEAIHSLTGEHRIYLGPAKGWRHTAVHTVESLAERNAIENKYPGLRVYCNFGKGQDHVWESDSKWHGTQPYAVRGGPVKFVQGVNDTNWRNWTKTDITDPGYEYMIHGSLNLEVVSINQKHRTEVWTSIHDTVGGRNGITFNKWFADPHFAPGIFAPRCQVSPLLMDPQLGNRTISVDWRIRGNHANAYSGTYEAYQEYMVVPA